MEQNQNKIEDELIKNIKSFIPELNPDTDSIIVLYKKGDAVIHIDHGTSENLKTSIESLLVSKKTSMLMKSIFTEWFSNQVKD